MKSLIAVAACAVLAACGSAPEEAAPEEAPVEEVAVDTTVGQPGTYEVTYSDGSVATLTSAEDGTFTVVRGEENGKGTWANKDGKICFDFEGEEVADRCWTSSPVAEDGTWTSTADDGEVVTVKSVEG